MYNVNDKNLMITYTNSETKETTYNDHTHTHTHTHTCMHELIFDKVINKHTQIHNQKSQHAYNDT